MGVLKSSRRLIPAERARHDLAGGRIEAYWEKVIRYGPIAYWQLNETAGVTAACSVNSPAQDGTYTGVTLANGTGPDGQPCPFFDGANDFVDVVSATLNTVFNGSVGTAMVWTQVANVDVWTDGTARAMFEYGANFNNRILIFRPVANNTINSWYTAGGVAEQINTGALADTDWMHWAITWDQPTANEVEAFKDGVSLGVSGTLGVWAGALVGGWTAIGARSNVPNEPWHGWISHAALWDTVLTQSQILDLATP